MAAALLVGCVGSMDGDGAPRPGQAGGTGGTTEETGGGVPVGPAKADFVCDRAKVAADFPMHRLSAIQYKNTLRDLLARLLGTGAAADKVMTGLGAALELIPPDGPKPINTTQKRTTYSRFDQDNSQELVDNTYAVAVAAGAQLTDPARLGTVAGACATDGNAANDDACLSDFIDRAGALALRRPLGAAEKTFFKADIYGSSSAAHPAAYADVIAAMLLMPQFLYHVEHGAGSVPGLPGTYELTAHELASRLSYDLWDTMPDAQLTQAAVSGAILMPGGLEAQVDRMLMDPRAQTTFGKFFREWLRRDSLDVLTDNLGDARFKAFAGRNAPTSGLREAMITEISDLTQHHVFDTAGTVRDLLTSNLSFTRNQELAKIYGGMPLWDGKSAPPVFPTGERPGLLSRAAFHAYKTPQTRPVLKGVFVREAILCDVLPPPPPSVAATEPVITPDMTTREKIEQLTQQKGSICYGCHGLSINPMGFASENYDSLGRVRSEQILFDDRGVEVGRRPIDTRTMPRIQGDADDHPVAGMAELVDRILESGKAEACLARQLYRYTFMATEDPTRDGCALKQMSDTLRNGGSMRKLLRESTLVANFRQRVIP